MNKEQRLKVYQKYNGHCAYCGKELEYKDMQVDHIKAKVRSEIYEGLSKEEINCMDNYNPSCRMCNYRKGGLTIEEFREEIKLQAQREMERFQAKMSEAYGLIEPHFERNVKFYFEKYNKKGIL